MLSPAAASPAQIPVHAVVAVKDLGRAKTRLAPALSPADRASLVLAMLSDTLAAAHASAISTVTVVTPDAEVTATATASGARVLAESPIADGQYDLNSALRHGAAEIRDSLGPVSVLALQADLPALRPAELNELLTIAPAGRSIVADHRGSGTAALLCRDPAAALDPRFGADSARAHVVSGAMRMAGAWPGLRLDVDTTGDLAEALRLGAGQATRAVLRGIGWSG